jgi:hypothetical protein
MKQPAGRDGTRGKGAAAPCQAEMFAQVVDGNHVQAAMRYRGAIQSEPVVKGDACSCYVPIAATQR